MMKDPGSMQPNRPRWQVNINGVIAPTLMVAVESPLTLSLASRLDFYRLLSEHATPHSENPVATYNHDNQAPKQCRTQEEGFECFIIKLELYGSIPDASAKSRTMKEHLACTMVEHLEELGLSAICASSRQWYLILVKLFVKRGMKLIQAEALERTHFRMHEQSVRNTHAVEGK